MAISETGDWLLFIALPLYVLQVSGSTLNTSAVFLAELAPAVLVGTVCGPVIDRRNLGRLLTALTCSQAILLLPLLWLGPTGYGSRMRLPPCRPPSRASPPLRCRRSSRRLSNRASCHERTPWRRRPATRPGSSAPRSAEFCCPCSGLRVSFSATWPASSPARHSSRDAAGPRRAQPPRGPARPTSRLTAIGDGARAVRRSPTLISALVISFLAAVAQGLFLVLFVLFVLRSLHAGDQVVGLLRGVQAVGGVLGGLLVGTWAQHLAARTLTVGGLAAFGLLSILTWNSPAITTETWWYVGLFIAVGLPATALVTGLLTGTQRASPRRVLGRVLSLIQVAQALGQGTGILLAGVLSSTVSLTVLLNVQAGCYLACAVVAVIGFAPIAERTRRRDDPYAAAPAGGPQ